MPHPRHRLEGRARRSRSSDRKLPVSLGATIVRIVSGDVVREIAFDGDAAQVERGQPRQPPQRSGQQRDRQQREQHVGAGLRQAHVERQRLQRGGAGHQDHPLAVTGGRRVEPCCGQQQQAQLLVRDARGLGRHRHQRMPGHAGRGVHLQQERLAVGRAHHQVGAPPAAALERPIGRQHDALDLGFLGGGQATGHVVVHFVGEVLVLVVVLALGCGDAHHRQRARRRALAEHRAGDLDAVDELLAQHVGVVARGQLHGVLHLRIAEHLGDADRRAFARRFHDQRQSELVGHAAHVGRRLLVDTQPQPARCRQALGQPDALGHHLVERDRRGHHARAGVRDAEQLERALHRAVFAVAAVQRDEAAHEAVALEFDQIAFGAGRRHGHPLPPNAVLPARRCPTTAKSRARPTCLPSARRSCRAHERRSTALSACASTGGAS